MLEAIIAGECAALGELYRRHAAALLGSALKLCRDRGDAEDVLHDVFVEAWRRAETYDPGRGSVASWLSVRLKSRASTSWCVAAGTQRCRDTTMPSRPRPRRAPSRPRASPYGGSWRE